MTPPTHKRMKMSCRRRGSAMVLVILAVVVGLTMGLAFLRTSSTATRVTEVVEDHAQARQVADAGLRMTIAYLERDTDWATDRAPGRWVDQEALLGGTVSVEVGFDTSAATQSIAVNDPSFEQDTDTLPTPLLSPPMSGTLGGWEVERNSLLGPVTGATVPQMRVGPSLLATDGAHVADIGFPLSVAGDASFAQTLAVSPLPDTRYALSVVVGKYSVLGLISDVEVQVWSGATLLGTSNDPAMLTLLDLGGGTNVYTLRFETDATPPADPLRIVLRADALVGVLSSVFFDDVRLVIEPDLPVTLTVTAAYGEATHRTTAVVVPHGPNTPATILSWCDE